MAIQTAPSPGAALPVLDKPRWSSTHILRWLAAQQNWDKIHFDQQFCKAVAKLPAPVINGALKQHLIMQFLWAAFPGGWPWRVDYQFTGPDYVGEKLQVRGQITGTHKVGPRTFISVQIDICNTDQAQATTGGTAVVLLDEGDAPVTHAIGIDAPDGMALSLQTLAPDAQTPEPLSARLGERIDARQSHYPIDLSRLRLFADAVMDMPALHFDAAAGAASPWGTVVAPPLFPLHGMEALPGSLPLNEDPAAQGREGVNEVGRDLSSLLGVAAAGGMNAGNRVQLHSLARLGERICAHSTLVGVRRRVGKRQGDMLFVETLNHYTESGGRPLVTERQTVVFRLFAT